MPHCIHYSTCGGCAFTTTHTPNKPERLRQALTKAGYPNPPIAPLMETPLHTRRRADLAATRKGAEIALGLHQSRSKHVVDMQECALLLPNILALLPNLRTLLRSFNAFKSTGSVLINDLDHGPDILLRMDADFTQPDRSRIINFAHDNHALRISIAKASATPEPVIILQPPVITFSGVPVEPPPGAFLQASRAGESAIIAAMLAGLPKLSAKSRLIELFAGSGTLTFALAQHARVEAYEGDAQAAAAQSKAIRANNLAGKISITHRDLHRRPIQPADFSSAACVVLDPPFAGATTQMRFLAMSNAPRIIYISCNPEALATDATQLHRAGYNLLGATPIDQFPYSENLESVAVFEKPKQ